ncbi:hypothetical protein HPB50_029341 [Hyalomma asiaticum]|nr:hypothetical protein HPB50_029341 [Hyalomma asiaticum]
MNGDGAENLQALGVADSDAGGQRSGTSDTVSEQQLALLQLQLKIAEAETEKQRLMLESQRLRAREGAEPNDGGESLSLGGRLKAEERKVYSKLKSSILDGLRLTAAEYERLFMGSRKGEKESWDQFAVRLENYFEYYVQSSKAVTKRYNLRDRERHSSEMNGDGAENLQALGVADSDAGGQRSGTSDTVSEQQLALLQLQLKIAEAETEKQRLMLESQRLRAREGAEPNDGGYLTGSRNLMCLHVTCLTKLWTFLQHYCDIIRNAYSIESRAPRDVDLTDDATTRVVRWSTSKREASETGVTQLQLTTTPGDALRQAQKSEDLSFVPHPLQAAEVQGDIAHITDT